MTAPVRAFAAAVAWILVTVVLAVAVLWLFLDVTGTATP